MRHTKIKDRCTKRKLTKCEVVAKTYDKIQTAFADVLERDSNIVSSKLSLPRTCKLLDISRKYWQKRGVKDWAIVVEKENRDE